MDSGEGPLQGRVALTRFGAVWTRQASPKGLRQAALTLLGAAATRICASGPPTPVRNDTVFRAELQVARSLVL